MTPEVSSINGFGKINKLTCEQEIVLHTLFESGITHVQDLEHYITDDVVRYGTRLSELEKKLVGAYREVVSAKLLRSHNR